MIEEILQDHIIKLLENKEDIPRLIDYRFHYEMKEISIITGVRRCGKSTLLKQIQEN